MYEKQMEVRKAQEDSNGEDCSKARQGLESQTSKVGYKKMRTISDMSCCFEREVRKGTHD
jgi:hypothetical protein